MKTLSRESIQRMVTGNGVGGGSGSGSAASELASMLAGYATETWVNDNYVSIEFFENLFELYNGQTKIDTNGTIPLDTSQLNIRAMFGFWTDFYVSALGNGGQAGASIYLSTLKDVSVGGVQDGQVLTYDSSLAEWVASSVSIPQSLPNPYALSWSGYSSGSYDGSVAASITIPSNTNQLTNGAGFITSSGSCAYATSAGSAGYATSAGSADYASSIPSHTLWGQSFNGTQNVSGDMSSVGSITMNGANRINPNGNALYIGNSNNSSWVYMADMASQSGDSYWKVYANGNATFGNVLSNGYVTALSDMREKIVVSDLLLSAEKIAEAPMIRYIWRNHKDDDIHVGSSAQFWKTIIPEAVPETDGRLSMDYGVIALMCSISLAKMSVNHEERLRELERRMGL